MQSEKENGNNKSEKTEILQKRISEKEEN